MEARNEIQMKLLKVLEQLPTVQQAEVLDFALSLQEHEQVCAWDAISDEVAAVLQAEFAAEDLSLAEAAMADYLSHLQREDEACPEEMSTWLT